MGESLEYSRGIFSYGRSYAVGTGRAIDEKMRESTGCANDERKQRTRVRTYVRYVGRVFQREIRDERSRPFEGQTTAESARRGHASTSMVDGINFRAVERECRASVVVTNFVSLRNKHTHARAPRPRLWPDRKNARARGRYRRSDAKYSARRCYPESVFATPTHRARACALVPASSLGNKRK